MGTKYFQGNQLFLDFTYNINIDRYEKQTISMTHYTHIARTVYQTTWYLNRLKDNNKNSYSFQASEQIFKRVKKFQLSTKLLRFIE